MAKFTMLIGISASGKSTYANNLKINNPELRILSFDLIREAVLGDRADQTDDPLVFDIMNRQTKKLLEQGFDVVYDATNISLKRRIAFLETLPEEANKEAIYFTCPIDLAIERDATRDNPVGREVIKRMYKSLDVPMVFEKFDYVRYIRVAKYTGIYDNEGGFRSADTIVDTRLNSYERYEDTFMHGHQEVLKCIDFAQDNPHHTFSVSRHMYKTMELLPNEASDNVIIAAALHDCGKPYCREYKDDGYAHFYGHDKVSAQLAVSLMLTDYYKREDILYVSTLINLHMRTHQEEGLPKLKKLVGEDLYKDLIMLYEADIKAK